MPTGSFTHKFNFTCAKTHTAPRLYTMVTQGVFSFLCSLVILLSQATAKQDYMNTTCIAGTPDYAPNSTYLTNLNTLLSNLASNAQIDYGFYNSSYGQDPDRVYATGLCRGDAAPDTCRSCFNNSGFLLPKHCPLHKRAVAVNDQCMLHYAEHSILGYIESDYRVYFWSETIVKDWHQYNYVLTKLLSRLRVKAATSHESHDPNRKFAAGHATSPSVPTIYAVVQCQPDLTVAQCNDCLEGAFSELQKCCNNRSGGGVVKFSCNFRYENSRF